MSDEPDLIASATLERLGIDPSTPDTQGVHRFIRVRKGLYALPGAGARPRDLLVLQAYAVAHQSEGTPLFSHHTAAAV